MTKTLFHSIQRFFSVARESVTKGCIIGYSIEKSGSIRLTSSVQSLPVQNIESFLTKSGVSGNCGEFRILSNEAGSIAMVALPENPSVHTVRSAVATGIKGLVSQGISNIAVDSMGDAQAAAEGAYLSTYSFPRPLHSTHSIKNPPSVSFANISSSPQQKLDWERGKAYAEVQNLARFLADSPANYLTPTEFCNEACNVLSPSTSNSTPLVHANVRGKDWIVKERMLAFLAVAKGSVQEPKFLEITCGDLSKKKPIVLIGKGITFDSGGISIKPANSMSSMKGDMGGAAAVLASIVGLATLSKSTPPHPVVGLIPLCENMPSGNAVKPGDVVQARNGKYIEIDNTDAEGRLILADALNYAQEKYDPSCIIDVATLTGAIDVALGAHAAGAFSSSNSLFDQLDESAQRTGESIWRMPLWDSYLPLLDSPVADIRNCTGNTRQAGACTAAIFLKQFLKFDRPLDWIHLDIAGVMENVPHSPWYGYLTSAYGNKLGAGSMSGFGARLLLDFLLHRK